VCVIYYIVFPILVLIIAGLFWRFGLWRMVVSRSPWPARLKVISNAHIDTWNLGDPNDYWHNVSVELRIAPLAIILIQGFYLELYVNDVLIRVQPGVGSMVKKGYILQPDTSIRVISEFDFWAEEQKPITKDIGLVVLETGVRKGRWAIKRRVLLLMD